MKRPLMPVALLYGGGLLIAECFQPPLPFLFALSLALSAAGVLIARLRPILVWPLIVCAGWTNFVWRTAVVSPTDLRVVQTNSAEIVTIRGELLETPSQRVFVRGEEEVWNSLARVKIRAVRRDTEWQSTFGNIVVTTPGILPDEFFAHQNVEITGVLAPPTGPVAPGLFDWRSYLRRQEIHFQLKTEGAGDWRIASPRKKFRPVADRFRAWAARALAIGIPVEDESLRLERALTLGDKTVLTDEVSEPFVRAATYHIFAVDGLRMAIVFGIFFALLRVLGVPRAWCGIVLLPLIWFYTALTGWPASAIRATVMLSVIVVGWALKRPSDLINSLFTAALIILIWDPQQLFQAGFQLSFVVVLCMILTLPTFDALARRLLRADPLLPEELRARWQKMLMRPTRYLLDLLFTSAAAWLGSIPLVAYYFNIVTPVSAPANVVAVPLCGLVLAANFIGLLFAGWFPAVAELFNHAGWFLMECIRVSSDWFARWPAAYRYVAAPGVFGMVLYYAILLSVFTGWLFKPKWRVLKFGSLGALTLFWLFQWQNSRSAIRATALPLNGGSAVFFDAPGTRDDLLIDCGNSNSVEFVMKPFLRAQGVNELPCVALTHGDLRHVGGIGLLESLFPVRQIVAGNAPSKSPVFRRALCGFESESNRVVRLNAADHLNAWTVLHPPGQTTFPQADDNALVLGGNFNGTRILLLSDLGKAGQEFVLNRACDVRAEIVIACLPEQGEPLCDGLLAKIQPEFIVITDSETPARKRAGPGLRRRLERYGAPVVFTRDAGAVTIWFEKSGWRATTMSGSKISHTR